MKNMIDILSNINIPNTRISAIDGKNEDVKSYVNIDYERNMSQYEIACTLSHIKVINYLNNFKGEYFMICEDDVSFNNINLFRENLENIIINCPSFDILLLSKIFNLELTELYTDWNNYIDNNNIQIAGTGCYIISRNGINNIIKNASYNENTFNFTNKKFDVADMYLYKNLKTYVYKYDFIGIQGYDSTIHSDHVGYQNDYLKIQNKIIINNLF
jgi:GR25 family glycosyltransferase involved in LPS biosynthesis